MQIPFVTVKRTKRRQLESMNSLARPPPLSDLPAEDLLSFLT